MIQKGKTDAACDFLRQFIRDYSNSDSEFDDDEAKEELAKLEKIKSISRNRKLL